MTTAKINSMQRILCLNVPFLSSKRRFVHNFLLSKSTNERRHAALSTKANPEMLEKSPEHQWIQDEREFLMKEAGFLARSLYRSCWRSIKLMRPGNEYDEQEFARREKEEKEGLGSMMVPPVDRENELHSRAEYYFQYVREHYNSDCTCLDKNPWRESDIEIFLHYVRIGEKRRKYILNDYKFEDPFGSKFPAERVDNFEKRAAELIRVTYKINNWILPSENFEEVEEDEDFDPELEDAGDEAAFLAQFKKVK